MSFRESVTTSYTQMKGPYYEIDPHREGQKILFYLPSFSHPLNVFCIGETYQ